MTDTRKKNRFQASILPIGSTPDGWEVSSLLDFAYRKAPMGNELVSPAEAHNRLLAGLIHAVVWNGRQIEMLRKKNAPKKRPNRKAKK